MVHGLLDLIIVKRMEANESAFCSLWTDHIRINDCADLFVNEKLVGDYFFNRLNPFVCEDAMAVIEEAANVCLRKGMDCYVHIHDKDKAVQNCLAASGFKWVDTMQTLRADSERVEYDNEKIDVIRVDLRSIPCWVETFCRSFDVLEWKSEVKEKIELHFKKMILLLSYFRVSNSSAKPAGCAALFPGQGLMGLYCLGTTPNFRGRGVAKKMVSVSLRTAQQERLELLFLQTFTNEGLLPLYKKLGFRFVYKKRVYALNK
ncbi:MAG TPA: GNAT family N-acetyltransferase [Candidatus Nitrosopolaris sp.]|nr:GNAT family N-acetyltransferase [Candidatus Nitrosopolaris sp.]